MLFDDYQRHFSDTKKTIDAMLDDIIKKFEVSIEDLKAHKTRIDEKNEKLKTDYELQLAQKEENH